MSFLQAEWRKLALINYIVEPELLRNYIPAGTELDLWNNKCYLSLVGFMFKNTRLLGIKIPFHVNFEEVNLRFYVTHKNGKEQKRGVVFIREIVPKPALTFIANSIYREHYRTLPMKHLWEPTANGLRTQYAWKSNSKWNQISIHSESDARPIDASSEVEFITEHYWGYARVSDQTTFEYEVTHPKWKHYPVIDFDIDVNFSDTYGNKFEFLNSLKPESVMLAEGSSITVENRRKLRF